MISRQEVPVFSVTHALGVSRGARSNGATVDVQTAVREQVSGASGASGGGRKGRPKSDPLSPPPRVYHGRPGEGGAE